MNFKSTLLGFAGAAMITLGAIGGVSAATTTADVSVKVGAPDNATLAASISGGTFTEVKYRTGNSFQNSTGSIVVTATDTRGVGSGWSVTLASNGDFKDGDKSFAVSNFALQAASSQGKNNANANGITGAAVGNVSPTAQSVLTASKGNGMGEFDATMQGTVKVPDNTLVGNYKTTLTVSITASNQSPEAHPLHPTRPWQLLPGSCAVPGSPGK